MTLTTEKLNEIYENPEQCSYSEIQEMAAMLANREAQPVTGECDQEVYKNGKSACLVVIPKETAEVICRGISAVTGCKVDWHYIGGRVHIKALAPPAPAVPDKATPGNIEILASGYSNGTFQLDDDEANLATEIWNACRAAMLAQPVSSGYKLPDGWIACSEQTPVADGAYWCWFGKEKPSVIQQRVCIWNDRNHEWCDSAVTHWMPLPAAPEGGNG
ncbi:DUF551 domain-containing protein [Serratia sp. IR-2025]|uniref:DUF551 domain-containing protein n=1 Tax=Serratia marcescens TaxID=615 RepID=UPI0027E3EF68|nr:DUF551 domain-containing protein [Serratia marcescens]